ncbi:MAG: NADH-quinone oxidoreductase subunit NuoF [Chlamydiota bacterium]
MTDIVQKNLQAQQERAYQKQKEQEGKILIQVGSATCEDAAGAKTVYEEFRKHIKASGREDVYLKKVGCTGRCSLEPIVSIFVPEQKKCIYQKVSREAVHEIFVSHILEKKPLEKYFLEKGAEKNRNPVQEELLHTPMTCSFFTVYGDVAFYSSQSRIALRNCGLIDPECIDEYLQHCGFQALGNVLAKGDRKATIEEVKQSKLRGRGGAGFPTGKKWEFVWNSPEKERYMICNADEGDPGAFMDRSMLESDPFSVMEGMMIAGYAIGAHKGFFYIRAEYPLAVERIGKAIEICRERGFLGKNILGSDFDFDLEIRLGAGAFVCGEETALIHSIEGDRGQPRIRPPYPAESGLWGKPTIINNVETLANLPVVFSMGGLKFGKIGTEKSGGTKVFAVSGKVTRTGLVEVPMGTSLKEIVFDICGGCPNGKKIKAIQMGGPAGGCIPVELMDTVVDYETIVKLGSIMGSGGLIVLDEDDCMVQLARYFMSFTQDESCGKCTPCREGTTRMLEILDRIVTGQGKLDDLVLLERLGKLLGKASLCGLGRAAPNPVLSTLRYFRKEYESHILEKKCPAKQCQKLITYEIDKDKCVGCGACAKNCPVLCISGERKSVHVINQDLCIKCGRCREVCRFGAVKKI